MTVRKSASHTSAWAIGPIQCVDNRGRDGGINPHVGVGDQDGIAFSCLDPGVDLPTSARGAVYDANTFSLCGAQGAVRRPPITNNEVNVHPSKRQYMINEPRKTIRLIEDGNDNGQP